MDGPASSLIAAGVRGRAYSGTANRQVDDTQAVRHGVGWYRLDISPIEYYELCRQPGFSALAAQTL